MILVTGGAGFIGANFVLDWLRESGEPVVDLDALTYAGNRENLASLHGDARHIFVHGDICDRALVDRLLVEHRPRAIVHFAAESHVDRSIHGPGAFIQTNVIGTFTLLEAARGFWRTLAEAERSAFRFLHVSTDEVYGSLGAADPAFAETKAYQPNSPYSASKAGSDHLVRAWHHTYGLPVLTTNCSNNYGPYQFPEKILPLFVTNLMDNIPVPLYGDGGNVRDWLHVLDHCRAVDLLIGKGSNGEVYNIGGGNDVMNVDLTHRILETLGKPRSLIKPVADRLGHDRRYCLDTAKVRSLGWSPRVSFDEGLGETVAWYRANEWWWRPIKEQDPAFKAYYETQYGSRHGA